MHAKILLVCRVLMAGLEGQTITRQLLELRRIVHDVLHRLWSHVCSCQMYTSRCGKRHLSILDHVRLFLNTPVPKETVQTDKQEARQDLHGLFGAARQVQPIPSIWPMLSLQLVRSKTTLSAG